MAKETFLLPLPVLFETGNHVAQIPDGRLRREWADRFVTFAKQALLGETPFVPTPFPAMQDVASWLEDFADHAMRQVGLVDRSLIDLFERQRALLKGTRHVYIWALDQALIGARPPLLPLPLYLQRVDLRRIELRKIDSARDHCEQFGPEAIGAEDMLRRPLRICDHRIAAQHH